MRNKYAIILTTILMAVLLNLASCSYVEPGVSWLADNMPKIETINDKALAYMQESYGDIFEMSDSHSYSIGSTESNEYHIFLKATGHPYDNIAVLSPWYDERKGEIFLTDYPHYLFGNDAGPEWEKMLNGLFPRMGYLAPKWEFATRDEINSGQRTKSISGSWAKYLGGLTKESALEEYMDKSPIYGILVLAEGTCFPDSESRPSSWNTISYIQSEDFLTELDSIDIKYDIKLYIFILSDDFFDELSADGRPAEQLFLQYSKIPEIMDPVDYVSRDPYLANKSVDRWLCSDRFVAAAKYTRDDGEVTRQYLVFGQ